MNNQARDASDQQSTFGRRRIVKGALGFVFGAIFGLIIGASLGSAALGLIFGATAGLMLGSAIDWRQRNTDNQSTK